MLGARLGTLQALDEALAVLQLLPLVGDPVMRNSFRNTVAYACAIAGDYPTATDLVDTLENDLLRLNLSFAFPYVWLTRAVLLVARRAFDEGLALLARASAEARRTGDAHVVASCAAVKARTLISTGRFNEAAAVAAFDHRSLIRAMRGELLATRALALACGSDPNHAQELAAEAASLTRTVEVPTLHKCINAIVASRTGSPSTKDEILATIALVRESRYVDGLITAYRGYPELSRLLASEKDHAGWLHELMSQAGDVELIQVAGLGTRQGANYLSPREAEVFALMRLGFSNKRIGAELFISESTTKVHVHRILEKLGAATRTEAVLKVPTVSHATPRRASSASDLFES
jgi:DNA-binding NarL/FixJ family response regulator